jgi:hypothetical protein
MRIQKSFSQTVFKGEAKKSSPAAGIFGAPIGPLAIQIKQSVGRFRPREQFKLKNNQYALLGFADDEAFCAAVPKEESGVFLLGPKDDGKRESAEQFKNECARIAATWER